MLMRVVLVCGPSGSGKSTYIAENLYRDAVDVIDLYQFQEMKSYPSGIHGVLMVRLSYAFLEDAVVAAVQKHILLETEKRRQRAQQGGAISSLPGGLVVIEGTYVKARRRADLIQDVKTVFDGYEDCAFECVCVINSRGNKFMRADFEIPTVEEGFDKVTVVEDFETETPIPDLQQIVDAQKSIDRIKDGCFFE
ncbi:ATP-binding protein [Adlercreutzia sp. ZJ304]|uniref:ATP-binding protein n=1 Tax=Adlercreutzia sp. ZJ304 TaxID=2709791 RepID=UPI0013EB9897|nr:ATP-binding protein [Adlercreutzia sp. ZJ304]